jgi:hypothetical protein
MALHTLGTAATTSLQCTQWFPAIVTTAGSGNVEAYADLAAIGQSISPPGMIGAVAWEQIPAAAGILFTASTHATTTLDTFATNTGGPLASIQVGAPVLGIGIVPGTFVAARTPTTGTPTSITLSQAATTNTTLVRIIVLPPMSRGMYIDAAAGRVILPQGRGAVKLFPGDYIAISNTGWPIVVSQNDISYAGSQWVFT